MNFPEKLKYTKDHEWVSVENDNIVTVGITEFAQSELGDIVFLEVETLNETLNANDVFGTVEAVKTVSDLFLPVAGKIIEVNSKAIDSPQLLNEDPYTNGWIIKMEVTNMADINDLLDSEAYKNHIAL
jgi:glycine cleavage system H protein